MRLNCLSFCAAVCLLWAGCGGSGPAPVVMIDGSSTVAPITSAIAEEFSHTHPRVRVPVGTSGTGGGFKKFSHGEIDICNASRPISAAEAAACEKNGVGYLELKVALDGLTVAVNPQNDWMKSISIAELKKIWEPGSTIRKWSEINSQYPDQPLKLFGPDTDSGTFDYFTEAVCHKSKASRSDYQQSADDNFLVTGVAGDKFALGYFGYAYYIENKGKVTAVAVSDEGEAVTPTQETIENGRYKPLSRPLYVYVSTEALRRPLTVEFLKYYLSPEGRALIPEVGYIPLAEEDYAHQIKALEAAIPTSPSTPSP
ncbi:PstS family phosphate ABC transporter substrate-binding protein [Planctomicrobium sp. SH664]|uniref:PstS family phosphate ABC transporter substrate-binding protein n=1 Tax=Planctomicrobium sp. SH664 TaxID=3448125 RepID=UPI003F5C9A59